MPHTPFSQVDPWTQVHDRIWAILEADPDFAAAVRPANRIKLTENDGANPFKENVQAGDLPECVVEPTTSTDEPAKTSMSASVTQAWSVKVATNDLRWHKAAGPMRWILLKAFAAAGDNLGLDFVVKTRINSSLSNTYDPIENRGTQGWTVLLTLTTVMEFYKSGQALAD